MVQNLKFLLLSTIICGLMGCATTIDYMVLGKGTPRGNEVQVGIIQFDNKWSALGGNLSCCWTYAGGTQSLYDTPPPKSVYVKWYDYDPGIFYEATIALSNDLYEFATHLPTFYWVGQKEIETDIDPHLIIGFGESGEVVVWISNAATDRNKTGRVLHEVGRGQATVIQPDENGRG